MSSHTAHCGYPSNTAVFHGLKSEGFWHLTWKYHELLLCYHGDSERPGCDNKSVERRCVLAVCDGETETARLLTWRERSFETYWLLSYNKMANKSYSQVCFFTVPWHKTATIYLYCKKPSYNCLKGVRLS